jgi:hypothetical protein
MKRIILVLILIFLFTSLSQAQIYKGFGVKAGTSIANQTGSSATIASEKIIPDFRYKFGFTGGIFKETRLIEKLNLVIGINYIQKGASYQSPIIETGQSQGIDYIHRNFNFMNIEMLAKYNENTNNYFPYILAGLRMDVFISADYTLNGNKLINYNNAIPISNNNKTFGGVAGLGFEYKYSKLISLFIEGTYNPDFTNLYEQTDSYGLKNYLKGNSFDIRTGIKF